MLSPLAVRWRQVLLRSSCLTSAIGVPGRGQPGFAVVCPYGGETVVIPLIEDNRAAIEALCKRYHVVRLEAFGSAANETFDPQSADLDFLVEFAPDAPTRPFRQYFDFLAELKRLFGREVELMEVRAMRNPYFIKSVNATRKVVYAA